MDPNTEHTIIVRRQPPETDRGKGRHKLLDLLHPPTCLFRLQDLYKYFKEANSNMNNDDNETSNGQNVLRRPNNINEHINQPFSDQELNLAIKN